MVVLCSVKAHKIFFMYLWLKITCLVAVVFIFNTSIIHVYMLFVAVEVNNHCITASIIQS